MGNKVYVGIDLGTTNTLVSYYKKDKNTMLKFSGSGNVLPSVMYVDPETEEITIGKEAYILGERIPENRIISAKTDMGQNVTYKLPLANGKTFTTTPVNVSAEILKTAKERIIKKLKLQDDDEICAVITVPAAFSGIQKEDTERAAELAGITCLGLKPEPVAAAIASVSNIANSMVFVVDIGGGTYDTAVVSFDENLTPHIVSQEGDRKLGGDNFDMVIYNYLVQKVGDEIGADLSTEESSEMSRESYLTIVGALHDRAREAKEELSRCEEYTMVCKDLCVIDGYNDNKPITLSYKITREKFNALASKIYKDIERRLDISISKFKEKGHSLNDITHLVLVGGSCYIPEVIRICENKIKKRSSMQCDKTTAVAEGAGIMADTWTTIGEKIGGLVAQSMGISIAGGKFSKIIKQDTAYPCENTEMFTTTYDNQEVVKIAIYYASPDKEDCIDVSKHEYYGYLMLDNIQKAKKGTPQIAVTFTFDSSEQLTVTAKDLATGSTNSLKVNRDILSVEQQRGGKPMAIDLLIDVSGSMSGSALSDAKKACRQMIDEVFDLNIHRTGITTFSNSAKSVCPITNDPKLLHKGVNSMEAVGGTNMQLGIQSSYKKLSSAKEEDKTIFLMTDGEPNWEDNSEKVAKSIRAEANVKLAVVYIGRKSDEGYSIAKKIAKANTLNDEKPLFYTSESMSELGKIFQKVYADITKAY
jgi:molecular chaperone DnaK